ncbi:uncharacterized protein METZ01_LOCUS337699 [marine metagenome]|uniref:Uncharacterized protein n=1 Tax=marine metagenome TaxID=408172 RepID=A0A382QIX9_9ZZZZ
MNYSIEKIYHFTCNDFGDGCDMWWSIACEMNIDKKTFYCPWCGHKHTPPHRNVSEYFGKEQSKRGIA